MSIKRYPIALIPLLLLLTPSLFGQADNAPTVSVIPSDRWCIENGYFKEKEGKRGKTIKAPEPQKAIKNNGDLKKLTREIRKGLKKEGFKPLSAKRRKKGKAPDFMVKVGWRVEGERFSLMMDADHGGSRAASANEGGQIKKDQQEVAALKKAVSENLGELSEQMQRYLEQIKENGKPTAIEVRFSPSAGLKPSSKCSDGEDRSIQQAFKTGIKKQAMSDDLRTGMATTNRMSFQGVRYPHDQEKKAFGRSVFRTAKSECSVLSDKEAKVDESEQGKVAIRIQ